MTTDETYKLIEDYPTYTQRIIELNDEIHLLMKALHDNCKYGEGLIKSHSLDGMPKGNKMYDPVYHAFMETEKLTRQYQEQIKQAAIEILGLIDKKAKVDEALNMLKPIERQVIELRHIKHLNWLAIAECTIYSDRQCRNIRDNAIKKIATKIQ